jgi:hypothetical protein
VQIGYFAGVVVRVLIASLHPPERRTAMMEHYELCVTRDRAL